MTFLDILLIFLGPWLVVGAVALVADPKATIAFLLRPVQGPPKRPIARPRPARWVVS
jgi:hypothetical protein